MNKTFRAIGLMSGTSMDGIDLAFIESNGKNTIKRKNFSYQPYEKSFKKQLHDLIYKKPEISEIKNVEKELTILHANLVNKFLKENKLSAKDIDVIAFHGHTIFHKPEDGITWQIGNAHLLANLCKIDVVADFRSRDIALGGQGAPLVPIYHFHLFAKHEKPIAVLNIGGISNITYFEGDDENEIEAFDVCFGNAPLDDLMKEKLGKDFDASGELAKKGNVDHLLADRILKNDIFHKKPPKSFDRDDFSKVIAPINNLKIEDALATFTYMHAKAIKINLDFLKKKPSEIFVCGGGRKNLALIDEMKKHLISIKITPVEEVGLNGDAIEAEAFAFLAIRSLKNLPISFAKTTGIKHKDISLDCNCASGGVLYKTTSKS